MARRGRTKRRTASNRLIVLAMAVVGGAGLIAATSEAGPSPAEKTADSTLQLQIRDALAETPAVAKFNIGVRVRDGIVTMNGPIPSREVAEQAVTIARKFAGVREVRDELYTPGVGDPLAKAMPQSVTTQRLAVPVEKLPPIIVNLPPVTARPVSLSLFEQIDRLRDRDRRFAEIRIEVRDGRVILRGRVARAQDAWDFTDQVSQVAGVLGVTQNISAK
jgi:osmotically-inducible protein OsmY